MENMLIYHKVIEKKLDKSRLFLPVKIGEGLRMSAVVTDRLTDYEKLVSENLSNLEFDADFHKDLHNLVSDLISVFQAIDNSKSNDPYFTFSSIKCLDNLLSSFICQIKKDTFYRARDERVSEIYQMYHVSIGQSLRCKSNRFSEAGYPALYLSSSIAACKAEIGTCGTIAEFKMKEEESLNVLDLTFLNFTENKLAGPYLDQKALHLMWPILMCCYNMVPKTRESKQKVFEKEEYIFPQLLSRYLRERGLADGIRYFTVREEHLNPEEKDMSDLVLFTKNYDERGYDEKLLSKFDIKILS